MPENEPVKIVPNCTSTVGLVLTVPENIVTAPALAGTVFDVFIKTASVMPFPSRVTLPLVPVPPVVVTAPRVMAPLATARTLPPVVVPFVFIVALPRVIEPTEDVPTV